MKRKVHAPVFLVEFHCVFYYFTRSQKWRERIVRQLHLWLVYIEESVSERECKLYAEGYGVKLSYLCIELLARR